MEIVNCVFYFLVNVPDINSFVFVTYSCCFIREENSLRKKKDNVNYLRPVRLDVEITARAVDNI